MSDDLRLPLTKDQKIRSMQNIEFIQKVVRSRTLKEDSMRKSRLLFLKWRLFHLLYSGFSAAAIFPAVFDYEIRYSRERIAQECTIDYTNDIYRWMIVILSIAALCCLIPYRIYKIKWRSNLQNVYELLPALHKDHLFDLIKMKRKSARRYMFSSMTIVEVILLFIIPYPYLHETVIVTQQIKFDTVHVCYYLAEFTYALMFFRILFFCRSLLNLGNYKTEVALRTCQKLRIPTGTGFALKCTVAKYPIHTLAYFVMSSVVIFGIVQRVFERPMMHYPGPYQGQDFDYPVNAMWNIMITMTTVGYGDVYPITFFGRIVTGVSAFWGGIIMSMTFVSLQSLFVLKNNEAKAYSLLNQAEAAANAIGAAFDFEYQKRKFNNKDLERFKELRRVCKNFSKVQSQYQIEDEDDKPKNNQPDKFHSIERKIEEVNSKLDKLIN